MNTPSSSTSPTTTHDPSTDTIKAAFAATAQQRAALFPDQLLPVNLDVLAASRAVSETFPRITMMREALRSLPDFDIAEVDRIQTYAEALLHANTKYLAAASPTAELPAMVAKATMLRDTFIADIRALATRHTLDDRRLGELKGGTGYLAIASDLGVVTSMLQDTWETIQGKTNVSAAELDEAQRLYPQIVFISDGNAKQATVLQAASEERARAFTLLVNAYEQVRRAATFLRWSQDDADKMFPSLWTQKGAGRPKKADATTPVTDAPATPATPVVTAPVAPSAVPSPLAPAGFPGGSPFANG